MSSIAVTTAFIPVHNPAAAALWYSEMLDLEILTTNNSSAVLGPTAGTTSITLLGPDSGIKVRPGLEWATCNFLVEDLYEKRATLQRLGVQTSELEGSADVCLYFTLQDPDGNTLLLTDR